MSVDAEAPVGVNEAPRLSQLEDLSVFEDDTSATLTIFVEDTESDAAELTLSATSSNEELLGAGSIVIAGSGLERTVSITPSQNTFGSSTITLKLTDGMGLSSSLSFVFTVNRSPLYFCDKGDSTWNSVANWYFNEDCDSAPANRLPGNGDSVTIQVGTFNDQPSIELKSFAGVLPTGEFQETLNIKILAGGSLLARGGSWFGSNEEGALLNFDNGAANYRTILGDASFDNSSVNSGTITGNAIFSDQSFNQGVVDGTATFSWAENQSLVVEGSALWGGTFGAIVDSDGNPILDWIFNGSSINVGTVPGNATFNDSSYNGGEFGSDTAGVVTGDAIFNDSSASSGRVLGTAIFNDSSWCGPGQFGLGSMQGDAIFMGGDVYCPVVGNAEFNGNAVLYSTVGGDALFWDSSSNHGNIGGNAQFLLTSTNMGVVSGDAVFWHESSNHYTNFGYGIVMGTATFHHFSYNSYFSEVHGDATFYDETYNLPLGDLRANAVFNDSSWNRGSIGGDVIFNGSSFNDGGSYSGSCTGTNGVVGGDGC